MKPARLLSVVLTAALSAVLLSPCAKAQADNEERERVRHPHLTPKTKFLHKKVSFSMLENNPVSEGIFALQEYNRKYGSGCYFGFWTIDGRCLFDARYEMMGGYPVFDHGAAVVKGLRNAKGVQPVTILYADGSARELPESYRKVSQFHDGVATVELGGMNAKGQSNFCIDTEGKKKWPTLGPGDILEVGYLRDGLRRVKVRTEPRRFSYVTRWGFIDDNGRWIIQPTLKDVREFKNGYALVIDENDKLKFIDTKGNTVYEFPGTTGALQYAAEISDISDGYFLNKSTFYDLKGNEVRKYYRATGFTGGYAMVRDDIDEPVYTVNTRFERIKTIYGSDLLTGNVVLGAGNPNFGEARLGTIDRRIVVTPSGDIRIVGARYPAAIGNFLPGDYAPCEFYAKDVTTGKEFNYLGYINRNGEFEVVMCADADGGGPFNGPFPIEPEPGDTTRYGDTWPPLPPVDTIPEGPKDLITARYKVTVKATPAEGGHVAGGGEFHYGDTVTIGARANEGWIISDVSCDNRFARTNKINRFVVRGDLDITVHFLKDDVADPVRGGTYSGSLEYKPNGERSAIGYNVPVYLETSATSAIESPYGPSTRGFLAIMLDPDEKIVDKSIDRSTGKERGTFSMNVFFVPMKVVGQTEENGRKYLLLDGGEVKVNNLRMLESGAKASDVSALESVMVNLMLMFDDMDATVQPASYRVEMTDIDEATGAFTFGELQRIDSRNGWIPAGSDVFEQIERGFFVTKVDRGFPAGYFRGVRMTPCVPCKDVVWTPSAKFFEGDESFMESFAKELGKNFRTFRSEHDEIRNLTMKDINDAFDRLIKGR